MNAAFSHQMPTSAEEIIQVDWADANASLSLNQGDTSIADIENLSFDDNTDFITFPVTGLNDDVVNVLST